MSTFALYAVIHRHAVSYTKVHPLTGQKRQIDCSAFTGSQHPHIDSNVLSDSSTPKKLPHHQQSILMTEHISQREGLRLRIPIRGWMSAALFSGHSPTQTRFERCKPLCGIGPRTSYSLMVEMESNHRGAWIEAENEET